MASATLAPYYNSSTTTTFSLVSTGKDGSKWQISGLGVGTPYTIETIRKIGPVTAKANDHIILRLSQTKNNSTTSLKSTGSITVDISIPRDTAAVSATDLRDMLGVTLSLLNDNAATAATSVARTALVDGRDL